MSESPTRRDVPFSWFGFLSLSLGIGALQMMLDRGQDLGWFGSGEVVVEAILSIVGFYFFIVDSATSKRPFIAVRIFRDWNFSVALVFMFIIGIILLATMALVTPFIQNLLGYPVLASGYLLGTRGVGTFFAMMLVGRLLGKYDARILIFIGLVLSTASLWVMVGWTTDTSASTIAIYSVVQGVGLGFVFVPLNTVAFATLPSALRTEGAALWTLIRNIGSSVGISIVIAQLTNMVTTFHSQLVEHVTPFNDAMRLPDAVTIAGQSLGTLARLDGLVTQQAAIIAYSNDFLLMTFVSLSAFPLLALIRAAKSAPAPSGQGLSAAAAME
jgi:DHA2 family multidrug resistance protein